MDVNHQQQSFEQVEEVVDLRSIWRGIQRQSALFLGVGMTTMLAFLIYIIVAEDLYTAETSIVIESDNENYINEGANRAPTDGTARARIDTEVELLRSRAMAMRVLKRLAVGETGTSRESDRMDFLSRGLFGQFADMVASDGSDKADSNDNSVSPASDATMSITETKSPPDLISSSETEAVDTDIEESLSPMESALRKLEVSVKPSSESGSVVPNTSIGQSSSGNLNPSISNATSSSEDNTTSVLDASDDINITAAAIEQLQKNIEVERVGQTMLIKVRAISSDPYTAAEIANIYAEEFILEKVEAQFSALRRANQWIDARLDTLKTQVRESEREAARLRALEGIVDEGLTSTSIANQRMARIAADLREARTELTVQNARYAAVRRVAESGNPNDLAAISLTSPLLDELRERLTLAEQQVAELETRYGNRHPRLVAAREESSRLRRQLRDELTRIVASLASELEIVRSRVFALQRELELEQNSLAEKATSEVRLRELSRDLQAPRAVYEALLSRKGELNQRDRLLKADARIVARARTPDEPSRPRRKLLLAGGFIVAFLLAAGAAYTAEMIDGRIRNTSDVRAQFGENAPVVVLPRINVRGLLFRSDIGKIAEKYVLKGADNLYREAMRELVFLLKSTEAGRANEPISISFASVFGGEGNSTTAFCFAAMLKAAGHKVIYLDCSGSSSKEFFKLSKNMELTDQSSDPSFTSSQPALTDETGSSNHIADEGANIDANIADTTSNNSLSVANNLTNDVFIEDLNTQLPLSFEGTLCGVTMAQLHDSERFEDFEDIEAPELKQTAEDLKSHFDYVIIDAPSLIMKSEANLIAAATDAVVVSLDWCKTTRAAAKVAVQRLIEMNAQILSFVINKADERQSYYFRPEDRNFYYRSKFKRT
ncbi:MAG: exopolysaccharide transport family protein [Pseudomonadota bacterium]